MSSPNQSPGKPPAGTKSPRLLAGGLIALVVIAVIGSTRAIILSPSDASSVRTNAGALAARSSAPTVMAPTAAAPTAEAPTASPPATVAASPDGLTVAPIARVRRSAPRAGSGPSTAREIATTSVSANSAIAEPVITTLTEPAVAEAPASPAPVAPTVGGGFTAGGPSASVVNWRALLSIPGVTFAAQQITDASSGTSAMSGARALRTHNNVSVSVDFDSLIGWHGFRAYVQHKIKSGRNGSGEASFMQNYSNIDAEDFNTFGEVFVEQKLLNDRLRIKFGRLDFNSEFAATDHSGSFLNASMGFSPSITAAPTYPLPVNGANLFISPREGLTIGVGMFDGESGAPAAPGSSSRFQIAQANHTWTLGSQALAGRIGVGAWRHTGLFSAYDDPDGIDPHVAGTHGWYSTFDQTLWQGAPHHEGDEARPVIAAYAQVGRADPTVQSIHTHQGGGLTFTGLSAKRSTDVFGLGVTHAAWADGRETIGEAYYQMPVFSHLSLVADYQNVRRRDTAFDLRSGSVFTMRTIVTF